MLMNQDKNQIHTVTERIMKEFYKMYDRKEISVYYDAADLSEPEKQERNFINY